MPDPSSVPALPPFYVQPVPLETARHGSWRLLPGDLAFAAATPSVPLTVSEFLAAGRSYPIVFAASDLSPVAVMGLQADNLFVVDGAWADGIYMPAYVRRYPFVLIEASDKLSFALGIDAASERVAQKGKAGAALFEDGQPAELTKQALEFCRLFNVDHQRTRAFTKALDEARVLVDRRADIALPDGRKLGLGGFKVIDPQAFIALPDETVLAWHKAGWLALAYYHLASLDLFQALLQRQARRAAGPSSHADIEAAEPAPILQ
jgi:hypothetical protein